MEPQDLVFNCRRVCKNWCNIINSKVWKIQLERNGFEVTKSHDLKWVYYYWILSKKNVLNRNLVKNNCGQDGFEHWESCKEEKPWKIEKPPVGCENFPEDINEEVLNHNCCFATRKDYKIQDINFSKEGITSRFLEIVKPTITFTDWYCGRFEYASYYQVDVRLINGQWDCFPHADPCNDGLFAIFRYCKEIGGENGAVWHKVSHVFENYSKKADFMIIEHSGKDLELRKGCYGCKVTGTSIVFSI